MPRAQWDLVASGLLYVAVTAFLGRDVLAHLTTGIANDAGDPLLTAAILHWNAHTIPLSAAWWQFPMFFPTGDVLAFSEHLLGLSVIAAPIAWLVNDPPATYNVVTLLTFPLCALAMYVLVRRLTGSAAGAFVAGLAFAFSPYRISQLPHVQMLATFWAPLALLGLHAYLETRQRRWLVLYGGAWMLQAAANGYMLFFFSVLVGLWTLWFVVAPRRWRALLEIAGATVLACLPLLPILYTYVTVHARHGFERRLDEIQFFSADVLAVLCASPQLTVWGWLQTACRPEGELFPGAAILLLYVGGMAVALGWLGRAGAPGTGRAVTWLRRFSLTVAAVSAGAVIAGLIVGRWRVEVGPVEISSSSTTRPMLICLGALAAALFASSGVRAALRRSSTAGFYLLAALAGWVLSLGPTIFIAGRPSGYAGPFAWMLLLPGADGLRVPARFWLTSTLCLAVVAGFVVPALTRTRSRAFGAAVLIVVALGVLADGWVGRIVSAPLPPPVPDAARLRGQVVLSLPAGDVRDVVPAYRAATGGWVSVNGYSGYGPGYYQAVQHGVRAELDGLFEPFRDGQDLHVVVAADAPRLRSLVERQPGAALTARSASGAQYVLPRRPVPRPAFGGTLGVQGVAASCSAGAISNAIDGDPETRWHCDTQRGDEVVTIDLGQPKQIGAVRHGLGPFAGDFPRELVIDTSIDGLEWQPAWTGSPVARVILAAFEEPKWPAPVFPFDARVARFVRLRQVGVDAQFYWSVAEIEILGGV